MGHRLSVIPADAILDPSLKGGDIRILGLLGKYTGDSGWCYYSQVKMARELNVSRSTVQLALNRLEEAGWIHRRARQTEDGRNTFYDYRVLLDRDLSDPKKAPPPEPEAAENDGDTPLPTDRHPCRPVGTPADISAPPADPGSAYPADPESAAYIRKIPESNPESSLSDALRAGEREVEDRKKVQEAFKRFGPTWPTWVSDSTATALKAWMALPPGERERAAELAPAYLAAEKASGRTKTCALAVYLTERRWEKLPAGTGTASAAKPVLKPYGKAWMAHRMWLLENMPPHEWKPAPMLARWAAEGREDLVAGPRRRARHRSVADLDDDANQNRGAMLREGTAAPDAEHYARIAKGSPEWLAWEAWHHARDWPWIDPPEHVVWVYVPAQWPEGAIAERLEA